MIRCHEGADGVCDDEAQWITDVGVIVCDYHSNWYSGPKRDIDKIKMTMREAWDLAKIERLW